MAETVRSLWSGDISFGLVTVPVKLASSAISSGPSFHRMSPDGSCRLRQKLYCPESDQEYNFSETALGYEIAPEQYVIVEREELDALKPESGHSIELLDFVKLEEVDPIYFHKTYYLLPDKRGGKPYQLLVEAMSEADMVGIGKFVMRRKEYLAAIRVVYERYLALETMYFFEEIKNKESLPDLKDESVSKKELSLARQLIDNYSGSFEPEKYENQYKQKVEEFLDEKSEDRTVAVDTPEKRKGKVIDLMDALKKSVEGKKSTSSKTSARKQSAAKKKSKKKTSDKKKSA